MSRNKPFIVVVGDVFSVVDAVVDVDVIVVAGDVLDVVGAVVDVEV